MNLSAIGLHVHAVKEQHVANVSKYQNDFI